MNYAKHTSRKTTAQTDQAKPEQIINNAGGYVFKVESWQMLDRFLILGSEGNTLYVSEKKMTRDNAANVEACLREDGPRAVKRIVEISKSGRAPKNDPAIFALALAAAADDPKTRELALDAIPEVCRIATHLFAFCETIGEFRGWGRALRNAVADWYTAKSTDALAMQVLKYQNRNGWSHRDVIRLAHPKSVHDARAAIFEWIRSGGTSGFSDGAVEMGLSPERSIKRDDAGNVTATTRSAV